MSGVSLDFTFDDAQVSRFLNGLSDVAIDALAYNVGALLESSTKERLATGQVSPEGEPWADWSEGYAATRSAHHSLLIDSGNPGLLDSIQNYSSGGTAEVGSNMVYAAIHQFGGAGAGKPEIVARPYLGVSTDDRADVRDLIMGDLAGLAQ